MFPFLLSWAAQLSNKLILAWCHPFLFILSRNKQNKKKLESNMTSSRKIDFNIFRVFSAQISNGNSRDFSLKDISVRKEVYRQNKISISLQKSIVVDFWKQNITSLSSHALFLTVQCSIHYCHLRGKLCRSISYVYFSRSQIVIMFSDKPHSKLRGQKRIRPSSSTYTSS